MERIGGTWLGLVRGVVLVLVAAVLVSCGDRPRAEGPMRIVVSIPPLEGLTRDLAPEDADVRVIVQPGQSAHGFDLRPSDVKALAEADLVVYVGLGLEPRLEDYLARNPSPHRRLACFADAVGIKAEGGHGHDHDHGHDDHHHGPIDPHLWVDPVLVKSFVPSLARVIGEGASAIGSSAAGEAQGELVGRIEGLDAEIREKLSPLNGRSIVTHHAAFGRLAERYGLKVATVLRPIESREPTPGELTAALAAIEKSNARAIFIEPQFNADAAGKIAKQARIPLGRLDPLGSGDWFALMRSNVDEIVRVLSGDGP